MITITLADGTQLENLTQSGSNYVSQTKIDESVFTDANLKTVSIYDSDTGSTQELKNVEFIQQLHYENFAGNTGYYLVFRELSAQEVLNKSNADDVTALQEAVVEIYESMMGV